MLSQFTAPKTKPKPKGAPNDATKATPKAGESACTLGMIRGGVLDQRQDFATQIKHRSNMYSAEVTNIFYYEHIQIANDRRICRTPISRGECFSVRNTSYAEKTFQEGVGASFRGGGHERPAASFSLSGLQSRFVMRIA